MKKILLIIVLFVLLGFIGFIIFRKDKNILFEPETMTVQVFFNNNLLDPEYSCYKVFSVEREIVRTQGVARAALEQLLQGPSQEEKDQGFYTSLNQGIVIQSLSVVNGVAKVDFNDQLEFQAGGSCLVSAIRAQITETLKQFSTVEEVVVSVNGRIGDILQP
jgi:spore germination protein GerM